MVHPYLRRRQGKEPVVYPSEALKQVLGRTWGVPIFQEQVMQIAIVAAGFTPGEADQVRRSMAAWQRKGGLEHFHDKLVGGMKARGYQPEFAEQIYQQVLGFGSYGFPESHAASFALLAYSSAWLKCHQPAAFCAALINSQPMGFYAPAQLVADARRAGVAMRPVDVTVSGWDCTLEIDPDSEPELRFGLRMISGMREEEALRIVAARTQQPFQSLDDLTHRASLNSRALKSLADADALSQLSGHRHQSRWTALGIERLPGLLAGTSAKETPLPLPVPREGQDIIADYRSVGLTLRRHPLEVLRPRLNQLKVSCAADLSHIKSGRLISVAGIVTHRQRPQTASGVLFVSLEDETGIANLIIWPKIQEQQRAAVLGSTLMVVKGELQVEESVIHIIARQVWDYSPWLGGMEMVAREFR
jgi:error-prone DNA polymerase